MPRRSRGERVKLHTLCAADSGTHPRVSPELRGTCAARPPAAVCLAQTRARSRPARTRVSAGRGGGRVEGQAAQRRCASRGLGALLPRWRTACPAPREPAAAGPAVFLTVGVNSGPFSRPGTHLPVGKTRFCRRQAFVFGGLESVPPPFPSERRKHLKCSSPY